MIPVGAVLLLILIAMSYSVAMTRRQKLSAPSKLPNRVPKKANNYCFVCKQNSSQAETHFMKDCPNLSEGDRQFIFNLYDKALRNRMVDAQDRDTGIGESLIDQVEEYYGLQDIVTANVVDAVARVVHVTNTPDDDWAHRAFLEGMAKLGGFPDTQHRVTVHPPTTQQPIAIPNKRTVQLPSDTVILTNNRVRLSASPTCTVTCNFNPGILDQPCIIDSGCTAEAIVSRHFQERAGANVFKTHIKNA